MSMLFHQVRFSRIGSSLSHCLPSSVMILEIPAGRGHVRKEDWVATSRRVTFGTSLPRCAEAACGSFKTY
jgi:hypothetical protein